MARLHLQPQLKVQPLITTKDIKISIEFIEKCKLTIKKRLQRPRQNKRHVFALYRASQHRVYKRKASIYNNNQGFLSCYQISSSVLDRSALDLTQCARVCVGLQGPCSAKLNDGARVSANVDVRLIVGLTLDRSTCVLDHTAPVCSITQYLCARSHSQGNSYILLRLISTLQSHSYVSDQQHT